ncbi:MAG: MBOAT family O-acyltransferase [Succinivibrio sp.]
MLFNTYQYFLIFLPLTAVLYFFFTKSRQFVLSKVFLLSASLFFYCYFKFDYIWILLCSVVFNFAAGSVLSSDIRNRKSACISKNSYRKVLLGVFVLVNIAALGFYKYTDFLIQDFNLIFGTSYTKPGIVLPLAISFFTFQQIAYLVDSYKGLTKEYDFLSYGVFVCFFPQLIAGPIVHHKDLIPQFFKARNLIPNYKNVFLGIVIFTIGLIKKALIADKLAQFATIGFDSAQSLDLATSWFISFCYTFQLYFDFSGYCDMAIGSALLFNIKLPVNFNSPYKALSIQDFWRRWHITLSSFLRDYLYFPLGGSRKGVGRTYVNLFIVFFITGIWHGAGNNFILWGMLHGAAIILHRIIKNAGVSLPKALAWILTFVFVDVAWVLFRAEDLTQALVFYSKMFDFDSINLLMFANLKENLKVLGINGSAFIYCLLSLVIVTVFKNSNEIVSVLDKGIFIKRFKELKWYSKALLSFVISLVLFYIVLAVLGSDYSEFIYFNF